MVCSRQINNLSGILNYLDDRPETQKVIVHLHHHPFLYPDEKDLVDVIVEKGGHWLKDGPAFMHVIAGRVDLLAFGHEHRHLDFSDTELSTKYRIPHIFSAGKCTKDSKEYEVDQKGRATENVLNSGLMGRLINIDDSGAMSVDTIVLG